MAFYPDELYRVLRERIDSGTPGDSYTKRLVTEGPPKMLRKLIEEAGEVAGALVEGDDAHLVEEMADLWYHGLVILASRGIGPERVNDCLEARHRRPR